MSDYRIEQYNEVKKEIASALASAGRAPDGAELIAVSKTFPASDILAVYKYLSGGQPYEAVYHLEAGSLSAAGGAYQHDYLS